MRLVYVIDEDVTRSLESPQMRCVVQVRVLPSGAGRVKHRRFRQSLTKEQHQSSIYQHILINRDEYGEDPIL